MTRSRSSRIKSAPDTESETAPGEVVTMGSTTSTVVPKTPTIRTTRNNGNIAGTSLPPRYNAAPRSTIIGSRATTNTSIGESKSSAGHIYGDNCGATSTVHHHQRSSHEHEGPSHTLLLCTGEITASDDEKEKGQSSPEKNADDGDKVLWANEEDNDSSDEMQSEGKEDSLSTYDWITLRELCISMGIGWGGPEPGAPQRSLLRRNNLVSKRSHNNRRSSAKRQIWKWQKNDPQLPLVKKLLQDEFILNKTTSSGIGVSDKEKKKSSASKPSSRPPSRRQPSRRQSYDNSDDDSSDSSSYSPSDEYISLKRVCKQMNIAWDGGSDVQFELKRNHLTSANYGNRHPNHWRWKRSDPELVVVKRLLQTKFVEQQRQHDDMPYEYFNDGGDDKIRIIRDDDVDDDDIGGRMGSTRKRTRRLVLLAKTIAATGTVISERDSVTIKDLYEELGIDYASEGNPGDATRTLLRKNGILKNNSGKYVWHKDDPQLDTVRALMRKRYKKVVDGKVDGKKVDGGKVVEEKEDTCVNPDIKDKFSDGGGDDGDDDERDGDGFDGNCGDDDDNDDSVAELQKLSSLKKRKLSMASKTSVTERKSNGYSSENGNTPLVNLQIDQITTFPTRLYKMISDVDKSGSHKRTISWLSHGKCFKIHDRRKLESKLIPKYFARAGKFESFQRNLLHYGFIRIENNEAHSSEDEGSYYNCHFKRNKPHLLHRITKVCGYRPTKENKKGKKRKAASLSTRTHTEMIRKEMLKNYNKDMQGQLQIDEDNESNRPVQAKKKKRRTIRKASQTNMYLATIEVVLPMVLSLAGTNENNSSETTVVGIYTSKELALQNINVAFEKKSKGYFADGQYSEEALYEFDRAENHVESFMETDDEAGGNCGDNNNALKVIERTENNNIRHKIYHMQDYDETEVIAYITRLAVDNTYSDADDSNELKMHGIVDRKRKKGQANNSNAKIGPPIVLVNEKACVGDHNNLHHQNHHQLMQLPAASTAVNTASTIQEGQPPLTKLLQQNDKAGNGNGALNKNNRPDISLKKPKQDFDDDLRGVTIRPSGKWQAQLYFAGKSRYLGVFKTRDEAAKAYEIARKELKSEFPGRLSRHESNFPNDQEARERVDSLRETVLGTRTTFVSKPLQSPLSVGRSPVQPSVGTTNLPELPTPSQQQQPSQQQLRTVSSQQQLPAQAHQT